MSSFDTKVEGKADQVTSLSDWLSTSLGPAVDGAGDQLASVKLDVGSEWEGQTADAVVSWAGSAVTDCDSISSSISSVATAVSTYSTVLSEVCQEAEWIRQDAVAAGLTVSGTVVHMPTDKEDEDYETKVETYNSLSIRMSDASTTLAAAQDDLRGSLSTVQTANSVLSAVDVTFNGATSWVVFETTRVIRISSADWASHNRWLAGEYQRMATTVGNAVEGNALLNHATKLEFKARSLEERAATFVQKTSRGVKVGGAALAGVGTYLGYKADREAGEGEWQAATSNGAATAVGLVVGSVVGSALLPGGGTAAGAFLGAAAATVVSTAAATATDKVVDFAFEHYEDVADAANKGWDVTKDAFGDTVDAAKSQWNKWFG